MAILELLVAALVGVVQGVLEWLPVSSEGVVALLLTILEFSPVEAVKIALILHAGTALAAIAYYRVEIGRYFGLLPAWRPGRAWGDQLASLTFLAVATAVSGIVGLAGYWLLLESASELGGGAFIALIGGLLIVTGGVQRVAEGTVLTDPELPRAVDAVLVGIGQGIAVLPGISRSGTTVSLLLLRGYDGETSFELSFMLAIPASIGAAALSFGEAGGLSGLPLEAVAAAFGASAIVGYLTIGSLLWVVRRVAFWGVCVGFGALAVVGGLGIVVF